MALTAATVIDEATAVFLNDAAKQMYTYAALVPMLRFANEKLEILLVQSSAPVQRKKSAIVSYTSGTTIAAPADMLVPIELWETNPGGTIFDLMGERQWEPEIVIGDSLTYWTFRDNLIQTPGSNSPRDVKIYYWRSLAVITDQNSNEDSSNFRIYLSAKTAELAARYVGENPTRADQLLNNEVKDAEDLVIGMYTKNQQGNRVRRRRFRSLNNRWW